MFKLILSINFVQQSKTVKQPNLPLQVLTFFTILLIFFMSSSVKSKFQLSQFSCNRARLVVFGITPIFRLRLALRTIWAGVLLCFALSYRMMSYLSTTLGQRRECKYMYPIFLCGLYQTLLRQIRMNFYLQNYWLYFAECQQLSEQLTIKIRDAQMFSISLLHTQLHKRPYLLKRSMHKLLPFPIHINCRPMQIIQINIVKLHKPESFLQFEYRIRIYMIESFSGYEKIFSFTSTLTDYCFDSLAQWDLIIVQSGCVNVFCISHLQSFTKDIGQELFVLDFGSSYCHKVQLLFIWQDLNWRCSLLFLLSISHNNKTYTNINQKINRSKTNFP